MPQRSVIEFEERRNIGLFKELCDLLVFLLYKWFCRFTIFDECLHCLSEALFNFCLLFFELNFLFLNSFPVLGNLFKLFDQSVFLLYHELLSRRFSLISFSLYLILFFLSLLIKFFILNLLSLFNLLFDLFSPFLRFLLFLLLNLLLLPSFLLLLLLFLFLLLLLLLSHLGQLGLQLLLPLLPLLLVLNLHLALPLCFLLLLHPRLILSLTRGLSRPRR